MIIALIFLVISVAILYPAYQIFKNLLDFRRLKERGLKVKGIITAFNVEETQEDTTYIPVVQFSTHANIEVIGKPLWVYREVAYISTPKEVEVIYMESNPRVFIIEGQKFDYRVFYIFVGIIITLPFFIQKTIEQNPELFEDISHFFDKF